MTNEELWQAALADIELQVSSANFITWFRNTSVTTQKEGEVVVCVPNGFTREWLEKKYQKFILRALRGLSPEVKGVRYVIQAKRAPEAAGERIRLASAQETRTLEREKKDQEPLEVFAVNKETNLNPRYTFENFIVGSFNELAHAATQAVVQSPGVTYNPLFIYGGVGLGKTHLLQATGNELVKRGHVVRYISSERFTNELVSALHNGKMGAFKEKYRKVDALIIDDIQFIAGKEKTQEEFFYTFNTLYENNKQIILSSDRPPKSIATLEERLRSRFEGGMLTDIGQPEYETRIAILRQRCLEKGVALREEAINCIAANIERNIRELEGALNLVLASGKKGGELGVDEIKSTLKHIISSPKRMVSPKKVFDVVTSFYEIKEKDLLGQDRRQEFSRPRQIAMYIMRNKLKNSYPSIGMKVGGRDHTTVIHACGKIEEEIKLDEVLREEIDLITHRIYSE